jgi:hypothetical protein
MALETWVSESKFWAYPDQITYKISDNQVKRKTRPDGFFTLTTSEQRFSYLLEIGRSTTQHLTGLNRPLARPRELD